MRFSLNAVFPVCVLGLTSTVSIGQTCPSGWMPGSSLPGTPFSTGVGSPNQHYATAATWWDVDGDGPLEGGPLMLGSYDFGDPAQAFHWQRDHWVAKGQPLIQPWRLVLLNNQPIANGSIASEWEAGFEDVIAWNGSSWERIGRFRAGLERPFETFPLQFLVIDQQLWVAGIFVEVNGIPARGLARWDGEQWHVPQIDVPISNPYFSMCEHQGDLYLCLVVDNENGGFGTSVLFRFDGQNLVQLAARTNTMVDAICSFQDRILLSAGAVGGMYDWIGGDTFVAHSPLQTDLRGWGLQGGNNSIVVRNGFAYIGGETYMRNNLRSFARFDGTVGSLAGAYSSNTIYIPAIMSLSNAPDGVLYGGNFVDLLVPNFIQSYGIAYRRDDDTWTSFGEGLGFNSQSSLRCGAVTQIVELNGQPHFLGVFQSAGSASTGSAARWDGQVMRAVVPGVAQGVQAPRAYDAAVVAGDIYAIGTFPGSSLTALGKATPTGWESSIPPQSLSVRGTPGGKLKADSDNSLVMRGVSNGQLVRFASGVWAEVTTRRVNGSVSDFEFFGGRIVVGGSFPSAPDGDSTQAPMPNIAAFDGTRYWPLADGLNGAVTKIVKWNNGLVVRGSFTASGSTQLPGGMALWNGSAFVPLFATVPQATVAENPILYEPVGTYRGSLLLATRNATIGSVVMTGLARLRTIGGEWEDMGANMPSGNWIINVAKEVNDELFVGGSFYRLGGWDAGSWIRYRDPLCCDSIDFNNDTSLFDPQDIEAFLSVYSEGPCVPESATCNDIDFNNDTSVFDPCDINSFLLMYSEGPCTPCGV